MSTTETNGAWSGHQVGDFLATVSRCRDEREALTVAMERACETLDAEFGAVLSDTGELVASVGAPSFDAEAVADVMAEAVVHPSVEVPTIGRCAAAIVSMEEIGLRMVVARVDREGFSPVERALLRNMGRVLSILIGNLRLVESLREQEERTSAFVRSSLDCIISIDADGRVIEWNPAAERTFGYPRNDAVGRSLSALIIPAHLREAHDRGMARFLATGEGPVIDQRIEVPAIDSGGTEFPVELTVTAGGGPRPTFTAYVRDIRSRKEAESALRASNERLSGLIENLNAAVLVEGEDRRVVLANRQFCDVFGLAAAPEELTGAACAEVLAEAVALAANPAMFAAGIAETFDAREAVIGEEVLFADGRIFERDHLPAWADDEPVGRLWVYRDVTARTLAEREIAAARDEAVAASQMKSSFLATMSHEIRTPMNGVVGLVDLLRATDLSLEQRDLVRMLNDSADHLMGVIDDILDFSRIEAGGLRLEEVPFSPATMVNDVVELFRPKATANGVPIEASVSETLESTVLGDPVRVRQVLQNLVGNAVKFTRRGRIDVRATLDPPGLDGGRVLRVSVADTGVGISKAAAERIFDPFVQADAATNRLFGGSGLGLSICKRLVELMGGTIGVSSHQGVGSTFWFHMPVHPAPDATPAAEPRRPAAGASRLARILVAEDNLVNQALVRRQLDLLGHRVTLSPDGAQAVETLATDPDGFDLVLMDCQMPGMDGFAATVAIRALSGPRARTPVIAMTANAMQEDRTACLSAGMNDYLAKPVRIEQLREMLDRWLPAADEPGLGAGEPEPAHAPVLDRAVIDGLIADLGGTGPEDLADLVELFIRELPARRTAIETALAAGDRDSLRAATHALRSPSLAFGLMELGSACARAEEACVHDALDRAATALADFPTLCERAAAAITSVARIGSGTNG